MRDELLHLVDGQWPDPFYATPKVIWEEYTDIISSNAFLLYHVYRYHADSNTGKCWPSLSLIARKLRWSWQRVRNARDELEAVGLISVKSRDKGRVAVITMLRPKPITVRERRPIIVGESAITQDDRPLTDGETNNNHKQEYKNNTSSKFCLSLLLELLDRQPMPHEIKKANELVQHYPADRIIEVVEWARTKEKPFGAAVHALEGGYPVGPKPHEAPIRGPQWLPPVQRPNKKGDQ